MASSSKSDQRKLEQKKRNWLDLPSDITANILHRIGVVDILENAQKVCTDWHKICKHPSMWRVVHMESFSEEDARPQLLKMYKHVVDRSQGQLVDITVEDIRDDDLLIYIANRSSQLRRLQIACSYGYTYKSWTEALKKFPLLEELSLVITKISKEGIESAGRCCPMLKTLKVNKKFSSDGATDEMAIVIGENFRELRHLQLIGDNMTNIGLLKILEGCPHLESLDLRYCLYISLHEGDILWKRCLQQIKCLKLPNDSLLGCPYMDAYYTSVLHKIEVFLNVLANRKV